MTGDDTRHLIELHGGTSLVKKNYLASVREFTRVEAFGDDVRSANALRDAHEAACEYFNSYEALAGYTESLSPSDAWRRQLAEDSYEVLKSRLAHQSFIVAAAQRLQLDAALFKPGDLAYKKMQHLILEHLPKQATELKERFTEVGLPILGFEDMPDERPETNPTTWRILTTAAAKVPGGIWVFGPVALGAATALILGLFLGSRNLAVFGGVFTFAFCVLFYAFAKGTADVASLAGPFRVLVWAIVGLFLILLATLYSCVFWSKPLDLRDWVKTTEQQTFVAKYDIFDSDSKPIAWLVNQGAVAIEAEDLDLAPKVLVSDNTVIVTFQNRLEATLVLTDIVGRRAYRRKISPAQARKTLHVPTDFSTGQQ